MKAVKAVKAVNNKHIVRNMQAITTFFVKSENFKKTAIFMYTISGFDKLSHRYIETEQYKKPFQHSSITWRCSLKLELLKNKQNVFSGEK